MNRYRRVLVTLMALIFTPVVSAQIYKCDGPDGPVYTDRECGPDAASVEISESSGLSGVSDETKAELAKRRADRELARAEDRKLKSNRTVINNQYTTINTEPTGRWLNRPYWGSKPEKPKPPEVTPRSPPGTIARRRK